MLKQLLAMALVGLASASVLAADPSLHEGIVVSAGDGKLVMTATDGKQHSHTVPDSAMVRVNGKPGKLADLKPGVRIRVMSDGAGKVMSVATIDDVKLPSLEGVACIAVAQRDF